MIVGVVIINSFLTCILTNFLHAELGTAVSAIESQIVGYASQAVPERGSLVAPTFNNVATKVLDLQDIVPSRTGDDPAIADADIDVQTLDGDGAMENQYFYLTDSAPDGEGWYMDDWETKVEKIFDFGEGICLTVNNMDDVKLTVAGEVDQESTQFPVPERGSILGNTRPVALDLQDIVPVRSGDDKAIADADIDVQTLDGDGAMENQYFYLTDSAPDGEGWYMDDWETKVDLVLKPGEAICLTVNNMDDVIITLPPVIAK